MSHCYEYVILVKHIFNRKTQTQKTVFLCIYVRNVHDKNSPNCVLTENSISKINNTKKFNRQFISQNIHLHVAFMAKF